jgi:hypothetical protein
MILVIATTRLPLQTSISSAGGQFVADFCNGRVLLGTLNKDSSPDRRWSWRGNQGFKVTNLSYIVPDDASTDILSSIQMRSGLILER